MTATAERKFTAEFGQNENFMNDLSQVKDAGIFNNHACSEEHVLVKRRTAEFG